MTHSRRTLEEVDAYPVPDLLTDRIVRLHDVPQVYAAGLLREAKRMLYLVPVSGESVAPSGRVDWAWHEMLMFTQFYRDFSAFIGTFVHHVPNPPANPVKPEESWDSIRQTLGMRRIETPKYTRTKANYERWFGEKPDVLYWP